MGSNYSLFFLLVTLHITPLLVESAMFAAMFCCDLGSFLHFLAETTPVVVKSGDPKKLQKAKKAAAVGATALVELRAAVCLGQKVTLYQSIKTATGMEHFICSDL